MADQRQRQMQQHGQGQHQGQQQQRTKQAVKAATAVTAGGSLLVLSGLTMAGTVVLLTLATPPLVLCSPVLVPAAITICLILTGFVAAGGLGAAALTVFMWMYRFLTGKHPPGADQLEEMRRKMASTARDVKEFGQQHITGSHPQSS